MAIKKVITLIKPTKKVTSQGTGGRGRKVKISTKHMNKNKRRKKKIKNRGKGDPEDLNIDNAYKTRWIWYHTILGIELAMVNVLLTAIVIILAVKI